LIHELDVGDNDSLRHDQARGQNGASNLSRSVAISSRRPLGAVNANEAAEAPTKILNARIVSYRSNVRGERRWKQNPTERFE
jgi:hypothetical protein